MEGIATGRRDIHDRKKAEARLQLLSKLGALSETMGHESIIDAMARLSIPDLADWCLVSVVENGQWQRATIAHRDPARAALAADLLRNRSQLDTLQIGRSALEGKSSLIADIEHATETPELSSTEI